MALKGKKKLNSASNEFNALSFLIEQRIKGINTCELVRVVAVNPDKNLDVQPLLNQIDGLEQAVPQSPIYQIPYVRIQAGTNGILIEPQVGDIGLCAYCQRDISSIKTLKGQANPLSDRYFSPSDGIYICSIASLNQEPTRFIHFKQDGIEINGNGQVTVNANEAIINCPCSINGDLTIDGEVTATGDVKAGTISLLTHVHGGVTPGDKTTGAPQ